MFGLMGFYHLLQHRSKNVSTHNVYVLQCQYLVYGTLHRAITNLLHEKP